MTNPSHTWANIATSPEGCWIWMGSLNHNGYGVISLKGAKSAHRVAFSLLVRALRPEEHLDHLCHDASVCRPPMPCLHRRCINPDHLEPVTLAENNRRAMRDTCRKGHPWTPESIIVRSAEGGRECRICNNERQRINRAKRKARQV